MKPLVQPGGGVSLEQLCRSACEHLGLDPKVLEEKHVEVKEDERGKVIGVVIRHPASSEPIHIEVKLPKLH